MDFRGKSCGTNLTGHPISFDEKLISLGIFQSTRNYCIRLEDKLRPKTRISDNKIYLDFEKYIMKMTTYDKWYQEKNHFGEPYPELVKFFRNYNPKGKVLDLGCGQGRDSLILARLGYDVTGVDTSRIGINQMIAEAKKENLDVKGIVSNIYEFHIDESYDIILLDSMFHFYKKDKEKETKLLEKIMKELKFNGVLCIFFWKSERIEKILMHIFKESSFKWEILEDRYIPYSEKNMDYKMLIARKIKAT